MSSSNESQCQLSRLSAEVEALKKYNSSLAQHIQDLEKECTELKSQVKDMKEKHNSMQEEAAERKLYTSKMETNNRINEKRIKELKEEIERLKTSNKKQGWKHEERVQKIRKEDMQCLKDQETMYQTIIADKESLNRRVVAGLQESISEKNAMISTAMQHLMTVHMANVQALKALPPPNGPNGNLLEIEYSQPQLEKGS